MTDEDDGEFEWEDQHRNVVKSAIVDDDFDD